MHFKLFTDPAVLFHVSRRLLAEFFGRFAHLLPKYSLPNPEFDLYHEALADVLRQPHQFPQPFLQALATVEDFAASEKLPLLDQNTDHTDSACLEHAIRLWLSSARCQRAVKPSQTRSNRKF